MYLDHITMDELKEKIKKNPVVIIPFGSLEEHGLHLPLSTDTIQIMEVLKIVEKETGVFIAPPVNYGVCRSTEEHLGTVGISPETLRTLTYDLLAGFRKQGFKKAILVSGHAGKLHMFSMIEACERFIKDYNRMRVFVYSEFDLMGKDVFKMIETPYDSHAGEIETSRMLYINEKLVKKGYKNIKEDKPEFFPGEIVRDKVRYWKSGIWGNPSLANKEKGRKTIALSSEKIIGIIKKISKK